MKLFFSFLCGFLLLSCNHSSNKQPTHLPFLPNEASIIFKVKDLKKTRSLLQNNSLLQQNKSNGLYTFFNTLEPFKTVAFNDIEFFLALSPLGKNDFGTTLILDTEIAKLVNFDTYYLTDRTYNNFLYKEYKINNQSLFAAQLNSSWVFSNDYLVIENHIKQFENSILYKHPKAFESLTNESVSLVIINPELEDISNRLFPNLPKEYQFQKQCTGWIAGDFDIDKNSLSFNAIYKPEGTTDITDLFKNIVPKSNQLSEVVPFNADYFTSVTYDDYETLLQNFAHINSKKYDAKSTKLNSFLSEFEEVGTIQHAKSQFVAFRMLNESIAIDNYLDYNSNAKDYRGISIFELTSPIDFSNLLKPVIPATSAQFFIQFGSFYIFSETIDGMRKIIPFLKNKTTLSHKKWYQTFSNTLTEESSYLSVVNTAYLNSELKNSLSKSNQKKWGNTLFREYKIAAFQMVREAQFSHLHLSTLKNLDEQKDFVVNETDNVILASDILSDPQFVTNYITKSKDILVQDVANKLHIYTNKGDLKWSKEINEPILGEIKQLDMYRNGRLQYIFTTPTKLYILDRNGKEVAPFPLQFDTPITQAVALFDYDNNRKYRIVITQDSELTMFDAKGKKVNGFKFKNKSKGTITHPPKHIRVGKKDFIVVNETNTGAHFLNRTGKKRVKPKQNLIKTSQEWFWYNNAFTSLNEDNTITQIKTDNTVSYAPAKLKLKGANTAATSKTWVSLADNNLSIKKNVIELEFGRYTPPEIFYIKNKIYVTTTNIDNKKVYLFDSNAKSIKGFPVFGTSSADINNVDKDANLELVVKGDQNSILYYEFR